MLFAAGNGNESVDNDGYASYERVLAVAACNDRGRRSVYSDYGEAVFCSFPSNDFGWPPEDHPEPLTPGIWTTDRTGRVGYSAEDYTNSFGGTSSACPGAAGGAALVLSHSPALCWDEVNELLRQSCEPLDPESSEYDEREHSELYGYGRLDAESGKAGHARLRDACPERRLIGESCVPVIPTSRTRLLIEVAPDDDPAESSGEVRATGATYRTAPSGSERERGAQGAAAPRWLTATPVTTAPRTNPWDLAHDLASQPATRAAPPVQFVEPDYLYRFVFEPPPEPAEMFRFGGGRSCELGRPDPAWPALEEFAWHLGAEFSGLGAACERVGAPTGNWVRVGILDTGYDPAHSTVPLGLLGELGRDFFDEDWMRPTRAPVASETTPVTALRASRCSPAAVSSRGACRASTTSWAVRPMPRWCRSVLRTRYCTSSAAQWPRASSMR